MDLEFKRIKKLLEEKFGYSREKTNWVRGWRTVNNEKQFIGWYPVPVGIFKTNKSNNSEEIGIISIVDEKGYGITIIKTLADEYRLSYFFPDGYSIDFVYDPEDNKLIFVKDEECPNNKDIYNENVLSL